MNLDLTVVVPTRNERDNIAPLLRRLEAVRPELRLDVLFVDDSTDETPRVIESEARRSSRSVGLIHRTESDRSGGLGGAVRAGLLAAHSELVCVMDADLQHPPELIGTLVDEARRSKADVVVASRYCDRGEMGELRLLRSAVSRGSTAFTRVLFPQRLSRVSDPLSGFFLVRAAAIDARRLRPRGFKILLEILLADDRLAVSEVPFYFGDRHSGESKACLREGGRYVRRMIELRAQRTFHRTSAA